MIARRLCGALILCSALSPAIALAQPASASDKAAARSLTQDGFEALKNKDYAGASDLFTRADKLFHAPTVTLGLARAQVGLGKLVNAQDLYNGLIHEPLPANPSEAFTRALDEGRAELEALTLRIPALILQVQGGEAPRVTLDGVEVQAAALGIKRPVDPGKHVVRAFAHRAMPGEVTVILAEGKVETVKLDLAPLPPGVPDVPEVVEAHAPQKATGSAASGDGGPTRGFWSTQRVAGAVVAGVGVAGIAAGSVLGVLTLGKISASKSDGSCTATLSACTAPGIQIQQDAMTTAHGSTAAFAVGGAALVAGVVLIATGGGAGAPKSGMRMTVGPVAGAGMTGMLVHGEW